MTERDLIDPKPELPDDTPIDRVRFSRIRNVRRERTKRISNLEANWPVKGIKFGRAAIEAMRTMS
jgi:hypothetical protein